jgi:hypothetical protein
MLIYEHKVYVPVGSRTNDNQKGNHRRDNFERKDGFISRIILGTSNPVEPCLIEIDQREGEPKRGSDVVCLTRSGI